MNILFVAEKPSITAIFKKVIEEHKNEFIDNYYFDYIRFVTHFDDDVLRMHKKDGVYYINGSIANFVPLKLNGIDIPMDTYLENLDSNFCYSPDIDVDKMDKIICICDYDSQGLLGFAKYLEVKNISTAFVSKVIDLSHNAIYHLLKDELYENSVSFYETFYKQLKENGFKCDYPKKQNIYLLRNEFGMSRTDFADYFHIPYRTVENWERNQAKCPDYLYELLEYKLVNEKLGNV